jgi:hypothetical protein
MSSLNLRTLAALGVAALLSGCGGCGGCSGEPETRLPPDAGAVALAPPPVAPTPPPPPPPAEPEVSPEEQARLEAMKAKLLGQKTPAELEAEAIARAAAEAQAAEEAARLAAAETRAPSRRRPKPSTDEDEEPELPTGPTTLSDAQFSSVVGGWRGVAHCLATTTIRGQERNGALSLGFTVSRDGLVKEVRVLSTSNDVAAQIAPCVSRGASKLKFPSFTAEDPAEKEAKFVF